MKIVWCLYDDGNCSYKKAIEQINNNEYEVHCVGINKQPFVSTGNYYYHRIDLSIFNENLIEELNMLPKPDIILASPPCESWSNADTISNYIKGSLELHNRLYFKLENQKFLEQGYKKMYRNFYDKQRKRLFGEATQLATSLILETYKPRVWIVENPETSKCWLYQDLYLNLFGIKNKTYYNCYDNYPVKKPTIFKSNIKLELRQTKIKNEIPWCKFQGYDIRSTIPLSLIKDIFNQIKEI